MSPRSRASWFIVVGLLAAAACRTEHATKTVPLENRIGWIDSGCLLIANGSLTSGTTVTAVVFGDNETIVDARVGPAATSPERCPPLRQGINGAKGTFAYEVTAATGSRIEIGIAVASGASRVNGGLDVDGDSKPERFTRCTTSEGISFGVWKDGPYEGTPLWSGYEYLGYDTEPDCPAK